MYLAIIVIVIIKYYFKINNILVVTLIDLNIFYGNECMNFNFQSHTCSLAHCIKVATTVEQLDSQSNSLIEQLRILLRTRCKDYVINGFTHDEITKLIRETACH